MLFPFFKNLKTANFYSGFFQVGYLKLGCEREISNVILISFCRFFCLFVHAKLLQACPTLCSPMNCSPPSSSVQRIFYARILK